MADRAHTDGAGSCEPADVGRGGHAGARSDNEPSAAAEEAGGPSRLRMLQEGFGQGFSSGVSELLGRQLDVKPAGWTRLPYAEFLSTLREPTCCWILSAFPASGQALPERPHARGDVEFNGCAWLELSRRIACLIVDFILGGSVGAFVPNRPLTSVERRLLRRVVEVAAASLGQAWPSEPGLGFSAAGGQPARPGERAAAPDEPVTVFVFHLTIGQEGGTGRLCVPAALLEQNAGPPIGAAACSGLVEVSATVPEITVSPEELEGLSAGDIVKTETPVDGEVIVRVAGIPKFTARLGTCNGRRAVTITGRVSHGDKGNP